MAVLDWNDLRFLLALRRAGSLGGAARELKVDTSTVSRRLAALEGALGVQLVTRTPEGVKFNDAGDTAAETAQAVEALVKKLEAHVGGRDRQTEGVVRVAVTEGFSTIIYEGLASLRAAHPNLFVELVVSPSRADLTRGDADIAVRLFREQSGDLVAKKVCTIGWSLYASEAYVERRGRPSLETLSRHDVIGYAEPASRSPGGRWLEGAARDARVVFRGVTVSAVSQAARTGMGVAILPCFVCRDEASLCRLTADVLAEGDAFLVTTAAAKDIARVRLVLDAIAALFEHESNVFAGRVTP